MCVCAIRLRLQATKAQSEWLCMLSLSCMILPRRGMHFFEDNVQIDVEDDVVAEDTDTDADADATKR